ncbi:PXMP2/4 family protein [Seminavis robusta]|uniref:PXMP2/4 family protein n=1 Tax=Seminavis robusta TaxID=568900 RepID=A0A9N8EHI8_9STRA|nr:PXMP2/4 family protein [Seminavis robusta]|eukprot:Sro1177_g249390.1 PXMP2/4 family protein (260) ;mRNA; f:17691-18684
MIPRIFLFSLWLPLVQLPAAVAFSSIDLPLNRRLAPKHNVLPVLTLRGGSEQEVSNNDSSTTSISLSQNTLSAVFLAGAQLYSQSLEKNPIITKSVTAGLIFAVSDLIAQGIERSADKKKPHDKKRTFAASLVGLLYFGPAAHFWYDNIFKLFPGTSLFSTLQKAAMGQMFFGPSFTCIFFATSLLQSGNFSLGNWFRKIKSDLAGAWLAGVGYWPLVDLISFSVIPMRWIPLFVNVCSLIWNIYLSIVANRKTKGAVA